MKIKTSGMILLMFALIFPAYPSADNEISVKVYPRISQSPATIRITFRIPRHPDNKEVRITVEDEASYIWKSTRGLDGEYEPITFPDVLVDHIGPGEYTIRAVLIRNEEGEDKEYVAKTSVMVV